MRSDSMKTALIRPQTSPTRAGDGEDAEPVEAIGVAERQRDILRDRGGRRERDVDAAGDQHDQQPGGQDADEGIGGEQVEQVLQGEEAVGARATAPSTSSEDHGEQPGLVGAAGSGCKQSRIDRRPQLGFRCRDAARNSPVMRPARMISTRCVW